ncbi:uncharacterized protein Dwil_GK19683 [Drosophila willistoni]|uniref:PPIase cyclophilin-type domain-containing protein n=1 Tax=Drosophila willistoni TaxID=7260 RepID=B4MP24_DROWI|nr:uncharacterized protein LOC6639695 [Drosophila willistoni]EDW73863.1 uncharacterized protein Dwil_GK19683 [Drosophila willistoni]
MFLRDDTGVKKPLVNSTVTPYLAAVRRGPFTMVTQPVYSSPLEKEPPAGPVHQHTFNVKKQALKNNHKYHRHMVEVPIPKKPMPKTRSRVVINEQRELYRQHRERLSNIKGKVNTCLPPPKIKIEGNGMELSYMEMLASLYKKSNNTLRTFTKSPERLAAGRWRNANVARERERKQNELNKKLHKGGDLFDTSYQQTQKSAKEASKSFSYEIPLHVLHRYENLMSQCDVGVLCKLLRPQIYIDVEVRNTRIQGRLSIQLFTEACPLVVLEFMRICTQQNPRCISFTRTFAPIWLEGKIALDPERGIDMRNIEHDFEVLNHGVDAGILSFPSRYVRGQARSALSFTISFKPLSILNGKRIAFGKIRKGLQLLERIQDATGHLGKCHHMIVVTGCGLL